MSALDDPSETSDPEPSTAELFSMITLLRNELTNAQTAIAAAASSAAAGTTTTSPSTAPTVADIVAAYQQINKPTTTVLLPVRGGIHPGTNLPYVGGGIIQDDYSMKLASLQTTGYRGPGQFRTSKQMSLNSMAISKATTSATSLKFDGKNELSPTEAMTQLSKADFLLAINDHVLNYGLQSMFQLLISDNKVPSHPFAQQTGKMNYVVDHPYVLSVRAAITEHTIRAAASARLGTSIEHPDDSLVAYDSYEQDMVHFTQMVVFSLISPRLRT